jgi:hypothetical protein
MLSKLMAFFSGMLRKADLATIYFIEIFVSNLFDINQSFLKSTYAIIIKAQSYNFKI